MDDLLLALQKREKTKALLYEKLALKSHTSPKNKKILRSIGKDELHHAVILKKYTGKEVRPSFLKVRKYMFLANIFGIVFVAKALLKEETHSEKKFMQAVKRYPALKIMLKHEKQHEKQLSKMIENVRFKYLGSIVLGLNDALVELTGVLAGFSLTLQQPKLIAVLGFITGTAASLSMASSEYFQVNAEESNKDASRAAIYTGIAYFFTVLFLIFPFIILNHTFYALGWTIVNALIVIALFTYYSSRTQKTPFKIKFLKMASISLGIAAFTFFISFILKKFFNFGI